MYGTIPNGDRPPDLGFCFFVVLILLLISVLETLDDSWLMCFIGRCLLPGTSTTLEVSRRQWIQDRCVRDFFYSEIILRYHNLQIYQSELVWWDWYCLFLNQYFQKARLWWTKTITKRFGSYLQESKVDMKGPNEW